MRRLSGINTSGSGVMLSNMMKAKSLSGDDKVSADVVFSEGGATTKISSTPGQLGTDEIRSVELSADLVFSVQEQSQKPGNANPGVVTDNIYASDSRDMFRRLEANGQLKKATSLPASSRISALVRTFSLPEKNNVDNTPFDALKQARPGRSSGALGAFIVNKIYLDNTEISDSEALRLAKVDNKGKHITKWPTRASLQAIEYKIEHKVGDEGEDEGVIQDKKFKPKLTSVIEEGGYQSGSSRESSPVSRDNGPSFQSERSVLPTQSSSPVLSPQDSLNNEQREAILLSSQPSPRIGEELSPVTSSKMSLPPQSSETVASLAGLLSENGGSLYGSSKTAVSDALTVVNSPRGLESDVLVSSNDLQLKNIESPRQFDSSQSEEVFESPIKLDSSQIENDVESPRQVGSSSGGEFFAKKSFNDIQSNLNEMERILLESSEKYSIKERPPTISNQGRVLDTDITETKTYNKENEEWAREKRDGNSIKNIPYDVGHYNPQKKLYSFKTLPRQLPNGSLANAERTVLLNQYQLSETLINLSRHTDFCKRGKNYELFFQLNDDNSLTAIAKESQVMRNLTGQTLNDGNGINFLFRNSCDNDLFSLPVAITQSPIQPQPQAPHPQPQPQQSQRQLYLGTYDSETSRYKFKTSESRTSQEVEFSELNFLRFLDINKDKFKSNGNFSVAVQIDDYGKAVAIPIPHKDDNQQPNSIDDYGKAVAIPIPHTKDDNQQPNSKYIHVGSEKIDLNELKLKIIDAEARENLILGLKTSRRPAGYVSPLRYSPIGISSRYNV
jgi:CTP:phosphocholine cytidylyltransferase-like protein